MKQQFIYYILNNILGSHNHDIYKQVRNISLYKNTQFRSGAILLFTFLGIQYFIGYLHHRTKSSQASNYVETTEMI